MSKRLILVSFVLFLMHHRLAYCKWYSRYSLEKQRLDNGAERRSVADDSEDDYDGTDDKTAPKEPDRTKTLRDKPSTHFDSNRQKSASDGEANQRKLGMRDRANLIRIKAAADEIETLLSKFDMGSSVDDTWSTYSAAKTSSTTRMIQQTTVSPFPGAYQGYIPVVANRTGTSNSKNESVPLSSGSKRSLKSRSHSHRSKTDGRWRRVSKDSSYRKKYKTQTNKNQPKLSKFKSNKNGIRTKGYQMTVLKTTNCSEFNAVESEILKTMWSLQNMMPKLGARINQGIRKLGNQAVDNTNEERADIKTNSDRISQLQQGLSGKIDDLRYNISILMTSQRELSKTVSGALEDMMHVLKQMVGLVTGKENEPESHDSKEKKQLPESPGAQTNKTNTTKEKPTETKHNDVINTNQTTSADNDVKRVNKITNGDNVDKGNGTSNKSKEVTTADQKRKDELTSPKRERKRQNIRKQKHHFLTDNVRRRNSNFSTGTSSSHNDHAIVNKFKNNDNFKNLHVHSNEKARPIERHRFNKTHGHTFQKLGSKNSKNMGWSHGKEYKRMPEKSKRKMKHHMDSVSNQTNKRFAKDGRESRGQDHLNGHFKHMHQLARSSSVDGNRYRPIERNTKSRNEEDIDKELERLLEQELGESDDN